MKFTKKFLLDYQKVLSKIDTGKIESIVNLLKKVKKSKGRVFFLGVGGSAGNASHAVNDFRKLCLIEAYTPTDNVSEFSARVNDEGMESTFIEYLKVCNLNKNDCLFILSVGGGDKKKKVSVNIVKALEYSKKINCKTVCIVGRNNGFAAKNCDQAFIMPNINKNLITPFAETTQVLVWHLLVSHPRLKKRETVW
jgi:D-sedoheptulose 7-phosphate isomerase